MDLSRDNSMPNMNVPSNLDFYRQIIELENNTSRNEILFNNLDHSQQRALQFLAHSRKFEYEYHQGCARVFRSALPSLSSPNPSHVVDPGLTGGAAGLGMWQSSQGVLPTQPQTIHETGFSYCMPEEYAPLPTWDSSNILLDILEPAHTIDRLQAQSIFTPDHATPGSNPLSTLQQVDTTRPSGAFSDVFQQNEGTSLLSQQQPDMNIGQAFTTDEAAPIPDFRYLEYESHRLSDSLFTMSTADTLLEMPPYNFSTVGSEVPSYSSDYPPRSRCNSLMSSTQLSPVASPWTTPQNLSEFVQTQSRQPASRSGSVSSFQSDRGRNRIKKIFRRSSSVSRHSLGIGENVFDSSQARSASRASSGRSRRTGPLDYLARVGMKAVKAVGGACWRCRILGKKCSDENPCDTCPKRNIPGITSWKAVGCKRGTLREEMQPVNLCPQSYDKGSAIETSSANQKSRDLVTCHQCKHQWCQDEHGLRCSRCKSEITESICPLEIAAGLFCLNKAIERREEDIMNESALGGDQTTLLGTFLRTLQNNTLVEDLGVSHRSTSLHSSLTSLIPLDQCILAIIWEMIDHPSSLSILSILNGGLEASLENFVILLRSAALYQAKLESDPHQLIAQSLICLRQSLETMRAKCFRIFEESSHSNCDSSLQICEVACIANLNSSLTQYIDQLSLVFFKKENLRSKTWWISVFYSLVIQSVVRKSLVMIAGNELATPLSIKHYLHLAVRLFIASSGGYDPLVRDWSGSNSQPPEEEISEIRNYEAAKLSVRQAHWSSIGLTSSGDYLQQLFEDDRLPIEDREVSEPSRLGYRRTPIDCGQCRRRKIRCIPAPEGPEKRCISCYWLKKNCDFDLSNQRGPSPKRWSTGSYAPTLSQRTPSPFEVSLKTNSRATEQTLFLSSNNSGNRRGSMLFETSPPLLSHDLFRMLPSNADPYSLHSNYAELSDPPDLYASLHAEHFVPPPEDYESTDPDLEIHEQELRFDGDLYTPRWIRRHGSKREGWCGMCRPGRWLVLKNSAFWYDKTFIHGVSASTGSVLQEPQEMRRMDGNQDVWEGLCGYCDQWVKLISSRKKGSTWFRHAYKCYIGRNTTGNRI